MRVVAVPPRLREPRARDRARLWPSAALIESVASLPALYPDARMSETAVVRAPTLEGALERAGSRARVWLALESLQVTGSFKVRGAITALAAARARGVSVVVCASAGNHGVGVALAASVLGMRATVVVPSASPEAKRQKLRAYGAELVISPSPHYDAAEELARAMAAERGAAFVSPYDDVHVVAGNGASLAHEIRRALGRSPAQLFAPCGGGGLVSGLAAGFAHLEGGAAPPVWGVQSDASPAMALSIERGSAVEALDGPPTLAEGLEGGVSAEAFARACASLEGVVVVSEASIARAMREAAASLGLVLEGSAACALVPLLLAGDVVAREGDVVVVVTGRNVDSSRLASVLAGS